MGGTKLKRKVASLTKRLIPKKLGEVADLLYTSRQDRLEEQRRVDDMKDFETSLKDHIIRELPKGEASGIAGKVARVSVFTKDVPTVEDWDLLYAYIKKNNAWDLLQRRINVEAVNERLEAGKKIPGLGTFTRTDVSCTKI